jgi:hypothetical protein
MVSSLFDISTYCKSELPKRDNYAIFVDLLFSGLKKFARKNKSKILDLTPPLPPMHIPNRNMYTCCYSKEGEYFGLKIPTVSCERRAYIVIPLHPEGDPTTMALQVYFYMCIEKICYDQDTYFYSQLKGKIA